MFRSKTRIALLSLAGLFFGLLVGLLLAYLGGDKPSHVFLVILKSAFGSRYDFGVTLYYTTPLIFTGLSVAIAFHSGLFNIGAEGQLNLAALATAVVGSTWVGLPPVLAPVVALVAGVTVGAFWGWIPGWLLTRRGSHEVINTIMLNFISAALSSWLVTAVLQNPGSQNPETRSVAPQYSTRSWDPLGKFFQDAPVSIAFFVALLLAAALWFFLFRTKWGYRIRAVGANEVAAQVAGISAARARQQAMAMAGGLAGFVALSEILGSVGKYRLGFSPDFGFVGIAVALLARNHPLVIPFTAMLFGALHKGAADLDIETEHVTRDLSMVIQALVVLFVSVASSMKLKRRKH